MKRMVAAVATAMAVATIFFAAPAQAKPMCGYPLTEVCDYLCHRGLVC